MIFPSNPDTLSELTGIDIPLIKELAMILQTLSTGFEINSEAYGIKALNAARLYIEIYGWYCMPASVHNILIHGATIIENAWLPIGQPSEEAQESCNKVPKN